MNTTDVEVTVTTTLAMWEFPGSPWVVAESAEAAKLILHNECGYGEFDPAKYDTPRRMDDAERFAMQYDDPESVPKDLQADEPCECSPEEIEQFGCDCVGASIVTMSAAEWCRYLGAGEFIGEFEA